MKSLLKGDDIHEIKVGLKQVMAVGAGEEHQEE
jgi:hypothetical protein